MTIDITQFQQTFFEESFEGLEVMESNLLHLEVGAPDVETIHNIFRAAHSIKGGSGTFGYLGVMAFTHLMETLLDEMRDGRRQVTQDIVDLLLHSVDCLRDMLIATRDGSDIDQHGVLALQKQYEHLFSATLPPASRQETALAPASPVQAVAAGEGQVSTRCGWHIRFRPYPHLLRRGNDPVRMFRELESLGQLNVQVDTSQMPAFTDLGPEECHLGWELTVQGNVCREQIEEAFAWVEGDCELHITPLVALDVPQVDPVAESVRQHQEPAPEHTEPAALCRSPTEPSPVAESFAGVERRSGAERRANAAVPETTSIRVNIDKIDALINMVGELVITQAMLSQLGERFDVSRLDKLRDGLDQLERNTRELQESVMRIRMVPISFTFNRFPRLVHDLSQKLGKMVELKMSGEQTELDKTVMEKIGDPLVHLVRNALDHGIESPSVRQAAGKAASGLLHLHAAHQGGEVIIEIRDDGAGLNTDKILDKARAQCLIADGEVLPDDKVYDLIFHPGLSTADTVSDVSGRGVGMDVVRRNIKELGGHIEVCSQGGQGTTFTIRLPLTLAILDGQLVRVGQETYIIPLVSIVESVQIEPELLSTMTGQVELYKFRDDYLPLVHLYDIFHITAANMTLTNALLVVVEAAGQRIGVVVNELLGQQQVVIKGLESNYKRLAGISGATILGDGTVALILDIAGLIDMAQRSPGKAERQNIVRATTAIV